MVFNRGLLNGSYKINVFCNEFTRIYDLEVDYDELSGDENYEFSKLCEMIGRFSDDEEELKFQKCTVVKLKLEIK